jgi:hypothetical protein
MERSFDALRSGKEDEVKLCLAWYVRRRKFEALMLGLKSEAVLFGAQVRERRVLMR